MFRKAGNTRKIEPYEIRIKKLHRFPLDKPSPPFYIHETLLNDVVSLAKLEHSSGVTPTRQISSRQGCSELSMSNHIYLFQ